jgi:hypothetical protein
MFFRFSPRIEYCFDLRRRFLIHLEKSHRSKEKVSCQLEQLQISIPYGTDRFFDWNPGCTPGYSDFVPSGLEEEFWG